MLRDQSNNSNETTKKIKCSFSFEMKSKQEKASMEKVCYFWSCVNLMLFHCCSAPLLSVVEDENTLMRKVYLFLRQNDKQAKPIVKIKRKIILALKKVQFFVIFLDGREK